MIFALAITGPTASGKTALSLAVARELGCEIISCDSMQIYKEMNIGTAKATEKERAEAPHHMIDFLSPTENYSAEEYRVDAMRVASEIESRGKTPLFVGGTGLYIDTVLRGRSQSSPPSDPELRRRLTDEGATEEGREALWQRLASFDPAQAELIHKNNLKRVVRALEIYLLSGRTKTSFDEESRRGTRDVNVGMITLDFHNRENLYSRVDSRVEAMFAEGLVEEVEALYGKGLLQKGGTASAAIGYKEIVSFIEGEISLDMAKEQIKLSTRRYAKRQLTWFRHEEDAKRLYLDREDGEIKGSEELKAEALTLARELLTRRQE